MRLSMASCQILSAIIYRRKWILVALILLVSLIYLYVSIGSKINRKVARDPIYIRAPTSIKTDKRGVMKRRFPKCIIFGTMKSGTTALRQLLATHPKIRVADHETFFFDTDDYHKGMEFYLNQMPLSYEDEITLEKSPSYFTSDEAMRRIFNFNKTIKLIVTFKHPVTRAISNFRQIKTGRSYISETFQEFVTGKSGSLNTQRKTLIKSVYVEHMKKWYSYFPKEQIHVVDGEKLMKEPLEELRLIEDFLGLEHAITNDNLYFNKDTGFYCMRKYHKDDWSCLKPRSWNTILYIDPKFVERLKEFYRPYNDQLSRLLNRTFDWD